MSAEGSDHIGRLRSALADRYAVERELGEGGMATVYLARDLKHERHVAIKVLRPELAAVVGAERFLAEIKTTANLQHPNILPLFDSGEADGFLYYVMPFLDGESLRDRLDREKQLPVAEAVDITIKVAAALHAAHARGVVHRDIKPANILLGEGGEPLVADFGIALALQHAGRGRLTETGLSLGTPYYMSPEQATADRDLDARSDVYSLACVLYEMLAGDPPHTASTAQAVIAKILTGQVPGVREHRSAVPAHVEAALAQALQKLPADRFASALQFAEALTDPGFTTATLATSVVGRPGGAWRWNRLSAATSALAAAALVLAAWGWLRPGPPLPPYRHGIGLPPSQAANPQSALPLPAPDGSFLVYSGPGDVSGTSQLWLKRRDEYQGVPIAGTTGTQAWDISPSGEWLALIVRSELRRVPVTGGASVTLARDVPPTGVVWVDEETIAFPSGRAPRGLALIPASGGEPSEVFVAEGGQHFVYVNGALPEGRGFIFQYCFEGQCEVRAYDRRDHEVRSLVPGEAGYYAASGHLVYVDGRGQFAVPFDLDALETRGESVPLGTVGAGPGQIRLSRGGTLVMRVGGTRGPIHEMVWVDRTGEPTPVDPGWVFDPDLSAASSGWAISPDGTRVAIGLVTDTGEDIWIKELRPQGRLDRVTFGAAREDRPRWSPDGRSVTFVLQTGDAERGLYQRRVDGTGRDSLLFGGDVAEGVWHPDGEWLLMRAGGVGPVAGGRDIVGIRPGTDTAAVPLLAEPYDEHAVRPSPDGRWLAYQSDQTGSLEVYLVPFPDVGEGRWPVSSGGGRAPLWSRDSGELFYLSDQNDMMAVSVDVVDAMPRLGPPRLLFRVPDEMLAFADAGAYYTSWDVAEDGRFLMVEAQGAPTAGEVVVVENFLTELREKVGDGR